MKFIPPKDFPQEFFQDFGKYALELFPGLLSEEAGADKFQRQNQFLKSWTAVRYRYRACSEANEEFKFLFANSSEFFGEWNSNEEHWYKVERCLYTFFMNGLSVFESFGYCLYFVGNAINAQAFVHVAAPKKITLGITTDAYCAAFPNTPISHRLAALRNDAEFCKLELIRNILAHRISGMIAIRGPLESWMQDQASAATN